MSLFQTKKKRSNFKITLTSLNYSNITGVLLIAATQTEIQLLAVTQNALISHAKNANKTTFFQKFSKKLKIASFRSASLTKVASRSLEYLTSFHLYKFIYLFRRESV